VIGRGSIKGRCQERRIPYRGYSTEALTASDAAAKFELNGSHDIEKCGAGEASWFARKRRHTIRREEVVRGSEIPPAANTMRYLKRRFDLADLAVRQMTALAEEGLSTVKSATKHPAKEKENNPGVLLRKAEAVPI
jgi:hypothetical protein